MPRRRGRRAGAAIDRARAETRADMEGVRPSSGQIREEVLVEVLRERPDPAWHDPAPLATALVANRLTDADRAAVEARLEGAPADLWAQTGGVGRERLVLNFAAHYGVEDALAHAGLSAAMPADEIHAMARGPVAAGGDPFLADLVLDAAGRAGVRVPQGGTVLDFGASSGRVLRLLAAARPDLTCLGCDPNEGAIAWAQEHLPMARFFVSPQRPPLELADASIDLAYAVSIWSHFAADPALVWLEEMYRVLRPGGGLVMTTHGFDCLAVQLRNGWVSDGTASAAAASMITTGHHFVDVFGADGDWGVRDPEWGNAYLTLDWLQSHVDGRFYTRLLHPGALDRVQDVIVLTRR